MQVKAQGQGHSMLSKMFWKVLNMCFIRVFRTIIQKQPNK
jgi:hypothetical protein